MSLMDIHLATDRALVAVDTHVAGPDGVLEVSKMLALPHANAVLAMRGELMFFSWVASALHMCMAQDLDGLIEAVPQVLAQTYGQRMAFADEHGPCPFAGLELAVVGWSPALKRMEGVRWERWPGDKGFKPTPIRPWSASPNPGYVPDALDTAEAMEAVALAQVGVLRCLSGLVAAGGRLLLAEVTRDALSIRTIADLETPQTII